MEKFLSEKNIFLIFCIYIIIFDFENVDIVNKEDRSRECIDYRFVIKSYHGLDRKKDCFERILFGRDTKKIFWFLGHKDFYATENYDKISLKKFRVGDLIKVYKVEINLLYQIST